MICSGLLIAPVRASGQSPQGAAVERPNIVLVIGDDHAWPDAGFMGSPWAETPALDRLAEGGLVFTQVFNTASFCRPSVRTLLTGLQPVVWWEGVGRVSPAGAGRAEERFLAEAATLPRLLAERGYATFQAGKAWDGFAASGFAEGVIAEPPRRPARQFVEVAREPLLGPAKAFIDRNLERPFFLWLAPLLPHYPFDASEADAARARARGVPEEAVGYFANIARLDRILAGLEAHLRARGLWEKTIVVYVSDNGWQSADVPRGRRQLGGEEGKGSARELGLRTPLVFGGGAVPGGRRVEARRSTLDVVPTLLDLGGAPVPASLPGASLVPVLRGAAPAASEALIGAMWSPPTEPGADGLRGFEGRTYFLRDDRWHYVWHRGNRHCHALYDAREAPAARRDVSASQLAEARRLRARVEAWLRGQGIAGPGFDELAARSGFEEPPLPPDPSACPWS